MNYPLGEVIPFNIVNKLYHAPWTSVNDHICSCPFYGIDLPFGNLFGQLIILNIERATHATAPIIIHFHKVVAKQYLRCSQI